MPYIYGSENLALSISAFLSLPTSLHLFLSPSPLPTPFLLLSISFLSFITELVITFLDIREGHHPVSHSHLKQYSHYHLFFISPCPTSSPSWWLHILFLHIPSLLSSLMVLARSFSLSLTIAFSYSWTPWFFSLVTIILPPFSHQD